MLIFNRSLEEDIFPQTMKQTDTVPLYKAKSILDGNNYRPISLLLTLSKVLEKVVIIIIIIIYFSLSPCVEFIQ